MSSLRVLSLFAGVGGLDLAYILTRLPRYGIVTI